MRHGVEVRWLLKEPLMRRGVLQHHRRALRQSQQPRAGLAVHRSRCRRVRRPRRPRVGHLAHPVWIAAVRVRVSCGFFGLLVGQRGAPFLHGPLHLARSPPPCVVLAAEFYQWSNRVTTYSSWTSSSSPT